MRIKAMQIYNRAPFHNLVLHFDESNICVLSGVNGAGKTTILSYIVDSFYEFAKQGYLNEFEGKNSKYYRVSSGLTVMDKQKTSFVYMRYANGGKTIDYIDIRNLTSKEEYDTVNSIDSPIAYDTIKQKMSSAKVLKHFTIKENTEAAALFSDNVLTYFPAYRYEQPSYLNDPYTISLSFKKEMGYSGYLPNPIEVTSDLDEVANWMMDIVLDSAIYQGDASTMLTQLNQIFTALLNGKIRQPVRLGIGPRQDGGTRIQIMNQLTNQQVYPSIFNMSSGEHALISLFCELIRQADQLGKTFDKVTGIVLVDEIDKHLHIKLQKETLPKLINKFPNIQFIVTSHSPFFNLGLTEEAEKSTRIFDLDNGGILCSPDCNQLFIEVYEMMIKKNEQYASKYNSILAQMKENTLPLIITEGKTDWKHLKAALRALNITDLEISFHEFNQNMGDTALMQLLSQIAIASPSRKIVGIFDRDNEEICAQINTPGDFYKRIAPNVFAMTIPTVNQTIYGPYTSIEHYYPKTQLLKETPEGRRLFLGDEFFESGMSKDKTFLTRAKGIQHKVKVNGVIDEKVYMLESDPACKTSVALPKDDFAQLIYDQNEYADGFDFSEFSKIFNIIRDIICLPN